MREYDLIAEWYASERVDQTGVPEALALAASLSRPARVLDIGCGNGLPLTKALLNADVHVVGLDSSPNMLARFRANCPTTPAVRSAVQALPFVDASFDGAIAWGVMFHQPQREQIQAIANVARVLKPSGRFWFTSGDVDDDSGNHVGVMNGVEFHYYSFTIDQYRRIFADHGLTLVNVTEDSGGNGYYLAQKA